MTDPMESLRSLEAAICGHLVQMNPCELYPDLWVLRDDANGHVRFTYAMVERGKVNAVAIFIMVEPYEGLPCLQLGYAVAENKRRQGLGAKVLEQAIAEFRNGISRSTIKEFFLEAVVGADNEAYNKIARKLLSESPTAGPDEFTGEPALQYFRKVQCAAAS